MNRRYVVLGLARPRAPWFATLTRWASAGAVPVDFVRCVSPEEMRARLASGRAFSACLLDAGAHGVDRDLIDTLRTAGAAVVIVNDTANRPVDRLGLGLDITAVLGADFSRSDLVAALDTHARTIVSVTGPALLDETFTSRRHGHCVAVTGPGGTGVSVLAAALAQNLGRHRGGGGSVLLADLALHADQAMFHAAPDIVPGVAELVESHRMGRPSEDQIRATAFEVPERGYHLLLGLRRHRDWAALRARSVSATVEGLLRSFAMVVADVDAETEGEDECGVVEVEERNVLARTVLRQADVVAVVGTADVKGVHSLLRTLTDLHNFGISPERVLTVVNHAPRHPRQRAEVVRALAELSPAHRNGTAKATTAGPVFVTTQRRVESSLRDAAPLPDTLGRDLAASVLSLQGRLVDLEPASAAGDPQRISPGRLGRFATDLAAS